MPTPGSRLDQGWRCGGLLCSLSPDDTKATCHRARSSSHYPFFYSSVSFYDSSQNAPKAVRHENAYLASVCSWARLCSIEGMRLLTRSWGLVQHVGNTAVQSLNQATIVFGMGKDIMWQGDVQLQGINERVNSKIHGVCFDEQR